MRYESFIKATTKNSAVKLSSLLPTVDALDEHTKKSYLQIQQWLRNKNIRPTDWGWLLKDGSLHPVKMKQLPAPEELLRMIFCNCNKRMWSLMWMSESWALLQVNLFWMLRRELY